LKPQNASLPMDAANRYSDWSDDALLQLAIDGGLTDEAESERRSEMQVRSLTKKDVDSLRTWEEQQKPPPPPPRKEFMGYGVRFVGKKFLSQEDEQTGVFVATEFVVLRFLPIIPIGSYRVTQEQGEFPKKEKRVPLQWDQVWTGIAPALFAMFIGLALCAASIYWGRRR
jgi:hypothetical protein